MTITSLVDNISEKPGIGSEHGLSLYIVTGSHKILFDMGQGTLFAENAAKLGIDLSEADIAVISHGHYDHGGGLKTFLSINGKASVYISRFAFEPHYGRKGEYIGIDAELKDSSRLILTEEEYGIDASLALYSCNEFPKSVALNTDSLTVFDGKETVPEDFRHEQYLLIEEDGKRVLISGCSHKGILNIVEWFKPDFLIGGFHFMNMGLDDNLKENVLKLDNYDTAYYTCHCTGASQFEYMKPFTDKIHYLSAGQTISI